MAGDLVDRLTAGEWRDPEDGERVQVAIRSIVIERSLAGSEGALVGALGLGRRLAVVSDPATDAVLGARVRRALDGIATVRQIALGDHPHSDQDTVDRIRAATTASDALIAVGSGTINDLCKYAAHCDGKPYAVFATAPSMNGYTSANAAITVDGHKKSLAAAVPRGVFVELDTLAKAPARMIRAGLGDSLCRPTAQADWLLSHRPHGTPYRRAPFDLLTQDEPRLLLEPEAVVAGAPDAIGSLARTLILSGLGMTICGGSYPASQGEHLISHYIDMFAPPDRAPFFHGEQVAVATVTMARLQEQLLDGPAPRLLPSTATPAALRTWMGDAAGDACWAEFQPKALDAAAAAAASARIAADWPGHRAAIRPVTLPAATIETALRRAGVPTRPQEIGLSDAFYQAAVARARYLRNRYGFLDLAGDTGLLGMRAAA
ncbi:MAG: sn-glycerol-1-phosphate dehydrogenase [Rhodospirillales bacterium]|nr:sn-glycerol-1-phosphate dehydrogenase [Rhodospirillales bacterium]